MTEAKKSLGNWGESYAAKYLQNNGYKILARNVHTPHGEIDIISQHIKTIVFVEVKTRRSKSFGYPEDSINQKKLTHMITSAEYYLQENPELGDDWRIDVIAIQQYTPNQPPEINHFENAIFGDF
jgi:putative endonuclease